jgi:hypothetical protein
MTRFPYYNVIRSFIYTIVCTHPKAAVYVVSLYVPNLDKEY